MSRLDIDQTIQCALPADQAKRIAIGTLTHLQWRVVTDQGPTVELEQGSQAKTRIIGGWFCPTSWFPAKARCHVREGVGCSLVDLHFEEALGFGILDGFFKKRYEVRFQQCLQAVDQALHTPAHNPFL